MFLPGYVLSCITALESAGFAAYAVGGCVRDSALGLTPHDYDLCTSARPEQTAEVFADHRLVTAGIKHGTVGVITDSGVVEITTFRREGGYQDNRRPDWVAFVDDIREDLARRDFTVNAMAYSPSRGFADPFGGREDLRSGILRAVGDPEARFREDSLRILRGARFSVTYDLAPEPVTARAMVELSALMENLARERVFEEVSRLLLKTDAAGLIRFAQVLAAVIPELGPMIGFDQHSPHHAYDVFTHTAYVTGTVPRDLTLRWAALLHDVGKVPTFTRDENGRGHFYGHAQAGAEMADRILLGLKAPTALREQTVALVDRHMTRLEPDRKQLRRSISRLGREMVGQLLMLQEADMGSKGTGEYQDDSRFSRIRELLEIIDAENACLQLRDLAVNGRDMMALGYSGPAVGQVLQSLLDRVVSEELPNDRETLLAAAKER